MSLVESRFPIPVTKKSFAFNPGLAFAKEGGNQGQSTTPIAQLLRSLNYLEKILPTSVPLRSILAEEPINKELISEGETILYRNIAEIFNLGPTIDPVQFILSQLKTANKIAEHIRKKFNIPKGRLNDEIDMEDPQIVRTLHNHLRKKGKSSQRGEKKVSTKVSYELRRQLLLAVLSGRLHMNTARNKCHELLSGLQYELNDDFYSDEIIGENQDKTFITVHDPGTNEVITYREKTDGDELKQNEKSILFHFRHVRLDDGTEVEVYSSDRKKDDVEAIIKSVARADGHEIDPTKEIEDSMGKRFVINGDNEMRKKFMQKYLKKIQKLYPNARIELDSSQRKESETYRGQSPLTDYEKVKIHFEGKTTPYEVICYSLKDFINSKVHVGKADKNGVYDGYAHDLYSLRRTAKVAKILFPEELYEYRFEELQKKAMQKKVNELLNAKEIEYE